MVPIEKKRGRVDPVMARRIRELRVDQNLSQEKLALRMGITFQQVQKYEAGTNAITAGRIRDLCRIFACSPNDLFDYHNKKPDMSVPRPSARGLRLLKNYEEIGSRSVRLAISNLLAAYHGREDDDDTE